MTVFTKSKGVTMMLDLCRFPHLSDANFMTTAKLWMFWIWPNGSETCCNQACTFQSHLNPGSNQSRLLVQDRRSRRPQDRRSRSLPVFDALKENDLKHTK